LCSVVDGTFLFYTGHNFGIDMNPTIDFDEDSVLPSTLDNEFNFDVDGVVMGKKCSRGVNFTIDEDETGEGNLS
jgi:hypothetical protein